MRMTDADGASHAPTTGQLGDTPHRSSATLRRLERLMLMVAAACAVLPPLASYQHWRAYEEATLQTEAEINARLFSDLVNRAPDLWQFQTDKLEDLLARRSKFGNAEENRRILDLQGQTIAESLGGLPAPLIRASEPLMDAGTPVATLVIERSLRPVLLQVSWTALLSAAFALLLHQLVSRLPLAALRRSLSQLHTERDKALLTLRSIGDAVVTTDAGQRVEYLNPVAERLSGWRSEEARGRPIKEVLRLLRADSRETVANPVEECLAALKIVELSNHTVLLRRGDERGIPHRGFGRAHPGPAGRRAGRHHGVP